METESPARGALRLPADCSIAGIQAVYELIRQSLDLHREVALDCSAVDKADVTAVQLLISATRTADVQGGRLNLTDLSDKLQSTLQRAGVPPSAIVASLPSQPDETK